MLSTPTYMLLRNVHMYLAHNCIPESISTLWHDTFSLVGIDVRNKRTVYTYMC